MARGLAGVLILLILPSGLPAQGRTAAASAGEWTMPGKDYAATRYSGLAQITSANAKHAEPRLDLLHRRARRPRGPAARRGQHDVRGHALPQRRSTPST